MPLAVETYVLEGRNVLSVFYSCENNPFIPVLILHVAFYTSFDEKQFANIFHGKTLVIV